ncbi:MAG TPA: dTDP-4-dehydrorhamnose reductase [Pyrinomonadaceae bacterium]|jgi:dTDP-4-dehydrorhamnose reductase|nr:dTDP-4-dehydrorhamnose reductase [Pyrinomonadaceae bacterium]
MKVLITGAGGLVGSHLTDQLSRSHDVLALGRTDLDITDADQVFAFVEKESPDVIINCAVLDVDECERDPEKAASVNVTGPENLAKTGSDSGAEIVHFSTNYVFNGKRDSGYYTIDDEREPINIYGQTKLDGERAVQAACERSYIVRTSWVFGKGKDSFLSTAGDSLKAGRKISAITDMQASTTFAKDLVGRVEEIVNRKRYGIYQIVNSGICSYYDFAKEVAKIVGLSEQEANELIIAVSAADAHPSAKRPLYTPMRCKLSEEIGLEPMRDWREALAEYIRHYEW